MCTPDLRVYFWMPFEIIVLVSQYLHPEKKKRTVFFLNVGKQQLLFLIFNNTFVLFLS